MGGMKIQFTLPSVFLAMTFVAIALGVIAFVMQGGREFTSDQLLDIALVLSPLWTIIAFLAYALGRRRLTLPQVIAFMVAEAIATAYFYACVMWAV
jgi:hypothetical protein